jgi:hypothetical protein
MSPEAINAEFGKPVWKCVTCKAETGLHWWNGLSVAMCSRPECSKAFGEKCKAQADAQDAYEAHCREVMG